MSHPRRPHVVANNRIVKAQKIEKIIQLNRPFQKGDSILEIGTGSGYQTAVLCMMGAQVYTVERQNKLFKIKNNIWW